MGVVGDDAEIKSTGEKSRGDSSGNFAAIQGPPSSRTAPALAVGTRTGNPAAPRTRGWPHGLVGPCRGGAPGRQRAWAALLGLHGRVDARERDHGRRDCLGCAQLAGGLVGDARTIHHRGGRPARDAGKDPGRSRGRASLRKPGSRSRAARVRATWHVWMGIAARPAGLGAFLAPDRVEAILVGTHPVALTPERLKRACRCSGTSSGRCSASTNSKSENSGGDREPIAKTDGATDVAADRQTPDNAQSTALRSLWLEVQICPLTPSRRHSQILVCSAISGGHNGGLAGGSNDCPPTTQSSNFDRIPPLRKWSRDFKLLAHQGPGFRTRRASKRASQREAGAFRISVSVGLQNSECGHGGGSAIGRVGAFTPLRRGAARAVAR